MQAQHLDSELQQTLITRGTLIALFANIGCYISFSLGAEERLIDKIQAAAFVNPKDQAILARRLNKDVKATVYDFKILLQTFLGYSAQPTSIRALRIWHII